jgi:anti-sigma28 factor (negative regulator of flagellin synthesis)
MRIEPTVDVTAVADPRESKSTTATQHPERSRSPSSIVQLSAAGTAAQARDPEEITAQNRTRLDEIREAIKHDKYPIDLDKLASKIVADDVARGSKGDTTS